MALKKSSRARKSIRSSVSAQMNKFMRMTRGNGAGIVAFGVVCVLGAVLVIASQSGPQTETAAASTSQVAAAQALAKTSAPGEGLAAESTDASAKPAEAKSGPVTITGCLERADEAFRLTNTSGAAAPKSRSWKSAFLRKGSATVQIIDASNRLKLRDHVGHRVSVTGTLVDREMRARSLQFVGATCSGNQRVKV